MNYAEEEVNEDSDSDFAVGRLDEDEDDEVADLEDGEEEDDSDTGRAPVRRRPAGSMRQPPARNESGMTSRVGSQRATTATSSVHTTGTVRFALGVHRKTSAD